MAFPHAYLESEQYAKLSPRAVKALIDIYGQYRGYNNGDLTATWSLMKKRGWTSKDQLYEAIKELQDLGWLIRTRKGGRDRVAPNLYAVTLRGIDYCGGKLDAGIAADPRPLNLWRLPDRSTEHTGKAKRFVKRLVRQTGHFGPVDGPNIVPFRQNQPAGRAEVGTFSKDGQPA